MPEDKSEPDELRHEVNGDMTDDQARDRVERERSDLKDFVKQLSPDDIRSGNWFETLLAQGLGSYTKKANWQYFRQRYAGMPADGIVEQRIRMASRYAALEGGISAGAYTATIAATIGTLGGASPATVPAAIASVMVDVAFISQLQLRLAWDIAVLYRVPLDLADPDDLWKLIRVAFTIKSGEAVREGAVKVVPALVRPVIKRFYSKGVLTAAKGLPFVGKFLLQRNVIKIGIPLVGVPLSVVLNRYTTLVAGRHASEVFRNEARIVEQGERLMTRTDHPRLLLWIAWLVISADGKTTENEALLMRHLVRIGRERYEIVDDRLASVVDLDPHDIWRQVDEACGDLTGLIAAAEAVALVDGPRTSSESKVIEELRTRLSHAT